MSVMQPKELATYLKGKKKLLLLTGALCDELDFDGKTLMDYAADIAKKLGLPVAATANTPKGLKERGVETAAKKVAIEIVDFMRWPEWREPIMAERPEALVFIGYNAVVGRGLVSAVQGAETVYLGNVYLEEATYSLPDSSLAQYQQNLEQIVQLL
ncbi:hypothetical protein ACFLX5_05955 [Chloroflexota bacterium]